jgi:hypothetical protein
VTPLMPTQLQWVPVYEDDGFVLFARAPTPLSFESRRGRELVGKLP